MGVGGLQEALGRYSDYEDGEAIFEEGSTGKDIYFIVSGAIEISYGSNGERNVMATLEKGDFFGEMASLMNDVRSMTATAIGPVRLYQLTLDEMLRYMRNNPEIMRDIFARMARRMRDTNVKVRGPRIETREAEYRAAIPPESKLSLLFRRFRFTR